MNDTLTESHHELDDMFVCSPITNAVEAATVRMLRTLDLPHEHVEVLCELQARMNMRWEVIVQHALIARIEDSPEWEARYPWE